MPKVRALFRLLLPSTVILGVVMVSIALGRRSGFFEPLELLWYDRLLQWESVQFPPLAEPAEQPEFITIVGIDSDDLKRYGWPLSDQTLADAIETLEQGSARVIGVDLYRDLDQPPGGEALQAALQNPKVVGIEEQVSGIPPHPALALEQVGFNDLVLDNDGVVRRSLLFVGTLEEAFYSFALRSALVYLAQVKPEAVPLTLEPEQSITIAGHSFDVLHPHSGGYDRLDHSGYQILLHYLGTTLPRVSLSQLLAGEVDPALIRDRVVLIGSVDPSLKDMFRTPYSSGLREEFLLSGVEIHGQVLQQLLGATLAGDPPVQFLSPWGENLWILVWIGGGLGIGYLLRRPLWSAIGIGIATTGLLATTFLSFKVLSAWLPLASPGIGLWGTWVLVLAYRAYQFQQQQQIVMRLLGQSTSPEVAQTLWTKRDTLLKSGKLPGQPLIATVLFADLCNFSTISEMMDPEVLLDWLNDSLDPVTKLICTHNGIVNKFTGDGFMAVFGLPMARRPQEITADAKSAVRCAIEIVQLLNTLNEQWLVEGKPQARMRIGIFTGRVIAGSLGGRERMEYGVLGDTVNTASRLESWDKDRMDYPCRILIGQSTYEHLVTDPDILAEMYLQSWGPQSLKGKAKLVEVYQVVPLGWKPVSLPAQAIVP
ncbi:MAG: CHASE2 domain-containing protein [Prochlorotrichaceae cyanobacterium]